MHKEIDDISNNKLKDNESMHLKEYEFSMLINTLNTRKSSHEV